MNRIDAQESGFSLVEVLVSAGIFVTALATLAHLLAVGARTSASARESTFSAVLAAHKLEELRSIAWGVDERGGPVGEAPQPGSEYLDRWGNVVGADAWPAAGITYFRRWSVELLPSHPSVTLVFHVTAGPVRGSGMRATPPPAYASLTTVKTRKAR